ncbi:MAG TPA: anti-sigma regulatory factor [Candidatus Sulfotelmatobacter sp.]|nr:anti-sigma regulatory factor [Candidatus Sulfotelmatobacter sp.]
MAVVHSDTMAVSSEADIVAVRRRVRELANQVGLSLVDQTKLVTAASELARNTVVYGGGGTLQLESLNGPRTGVRLIFSDQGPGIPDIELAMRDGFTTGTGLGLGLGGAKRLVNEFEIQSSVGRGTKVALTRWK